MSLEKQLEELKKLHEQNRDGMEEWRRKKTDGVIKFMEKVIKEQY
jgi:hypothetical protein